MKKILQILLASVASCFCLQQATANSTWPVFRGSSGTGAIKGETPPTTWSDTENIKWKASIPGAGFATPIIWNDRVFLLTAIPTGGGGEGTPQQFTVMALDRATGETVWQRTAREEVPHEGHHPSHGYASSTPTTDGEHLYAFFGSRGLYCYDLDGNLMWEKDFGDMRTRMGFGEATSPVLAGSHLIINWDEEGDSFIVALDKLTGDEVWRQSRDERTSWTTPLVVEVGGTLQAIVAGTNRTRSYDTKTGELVWEAGGLTSNVIPMPVTGHGMVYVMSGYRGRAIQAIKLTAKGDVTDSADIVWSARHSAPYVASPVLSGNRLYVTKGIDAYLTCFDALSGEVHYQDQALEGVRGIYASPLAANGYLYVFGREGTSVVLKDSEAFEVVATNKLSDRIDASPVVVDNELYIRGHNFLYCIAQ
jgi:outer membrane protein assembly factor BamB